MEFRPCIDIHNGKVKQIVGGSLGQEEITNFVSEQDASFYAKFYQKNNLKGGHVILLDAAGSPFYEKTKKEALSALLSFPLGLQVGGGITPENGAEFLEAGASHVIVTSYVFRDGRIHYDRLKEISNVVGKERLVLDMSCRKVEGEYRVATDRWQRITREKVSGSLFKRLEEYCSEFLIHAVDVEGKSAGIEKELVEMLGSFHTLPITYAGGVRNKEDLSLLKELGKDRLHVTIGSSLDIFGGSLSFEEVLAFTHTKKL